MLGAIINALSSVFAWFGKASVTVFQAIQDITIDLIITAFGLFLSAIDTLISSAPTPQFLTQYPLQSLIGQMDSDVLYFVSVFNVPQGLAMLDAGVIFRLFVRELFALSQRWQHGRFL